MSTANILKNPPGNVLLIQLGDIGDVVLATPTFRAFRETYPDARVSVLVRKGYGSLLAGDPHLHEVLEVTKARSKLLEASENFRLAGRLRRARYDLVFDLRTGDRGAILAFLSRAPLKVAFGGVGAFWRRYVFTRMIRQEELRVAPPPAHPGADQSLRLVASIGVGTSDSLPKLYVTEQAAAGVRRLLAAEGLPGDARFITVNPFSRWKYKEWGYRKWVEVIDGIRARYGLPALVVGAKEEAEAAAGIAGGCRPEARSVAGKTTLGELAALLSRSTLHLGVDSAAPHIASAVGAPTVTIFGPSNWKSWIVPDDTHRVVTADMSCIPCNRRGCDDTEACRCLEELEAPAVLEQIEAVFRKL